MRRFVTIGTFPFSRISLYKDLESSSWPEDGLVNHGVVARLLGGLGRNDEDAPRGGNEDYPLDEPVFAERVPSIVLDADSSQHSAIVDVLSGHSLVIQGPPGTGKSQTIANTIAAAVDAGKHVLFVAEKSAALNVVASRLRHCGFGPFMLELHSDKARKADVIASLRERLAQAPTESSDGLGRKLEQRLVNRDKLRRYVELMSQPVGKLGRSLHQVMWQVTHLGAEFANALPAGLEKASVAGAHAIDQRALEDTRHLLDALAAARDALIKEFGAISQHPWHGARATNPFESASISDAAKAAHGALTCLIDALGRIGLPGLETPVTPSRLQAWLHQAARIPALPGDPLLVGTALKSPGALAKIGTLLDTWRALATRLGGLFADVASVDVEAVSELLADCAELGLPARLDALKEAAAEAHQEAMLLEEQIAELKRVCRRLGLKTAPTEDQALALVEVLLVLNKTSVEALSTRTSGMRVEGSDLLIANAQRRAQALRGHETDLDKEMDLTRAGRDHSPEVLHKMSDVLSQAGVLAVVRPETWRAAGTWKQLRRRPVSAGRLVRARALRAVADHLAEVGEFKRDETLRSLLGPTFSGHETDFELVTQAAYLLRRVSALMKSGPELGQVAALFLGGDAHTLATLGAKLSPRLLNGLRDALSEALDRGETLEQRLAGIRQRGAKLAAVCERAGRVGMLDTALLPTQRDHNNSWLLVEELEKYRSLDENVAKLGTVLGTSFEPLRKDTAPLRTALETAQSLDRQGLPALIVEALRQASSPEARRSEFACSATEVAELLGAYRSAWVEFQTIAAVDEPAFLGSAFDAADINDSAKRLGRALEHDFSLADWMRYLKARAAALRSPGAPIAEAYDGGDRPEPRLADVLELCLVRTLVRQWLSTEAVELADLSGVALADARSRFGSLDKQINGLEAKRIAYKLSQQPYPFGNDRGPRAHWTDGALIENEAAKRKRHVPVRTLVQRAQGALRAMKPIWLMSPLTVAQYVPQVPGFFDLMIIDEASQMRPADALGAIVRARQSIVVGDPLQLPPTDFFNTAASPAGG